ncbi:hypothetical protein PIROE2DRAFT_14140 [Piromyces sp. E2]|nr:hypothetical protein PIROE2DRAFT_14140 [Piromyces sp. E2]|eukprot:OUM60149.1 hypothetical protein PIROE2DRAFT_14140 [Piromyces sp. E2]
MKFLLLNILLTIIGLASCAAVNYETGEKIYIKVNSFSSSNDRIQFKLNNVSINNSDVIKFNIMRNNYDYMPKKTSIIVRDGAGSFTKWNDLDFSKYSMYDGWYELSATAGKKTNTLGFTISGTNFKVNDVITIKNININGKKISFRKDDWSEWEQPKLSFSLSTFSSNSSSSSVSKPTPKPDSTSSGVTIKNIGMINTGPGVDCSKEMSIAWHSPYEANYIEYTLASDTGFKKAIRKNVSGIYVGESREWIDENVKSVTFYSCKAYLNNLTPKSNYIYRVGNKYEVSEVKKFKTAAGTRENFSFAWLADVHTQDKTSTYRENIKNLINRMDNIDFVMFSGDISNIGNKYNQWEYFSGNPSLSNYMYATIVGNHDYYKTVDGHSKVRKDKKDRGYFSNKWYLDWAAVPITSTYGNKKLEGSNYYFIYNRVLFINVDSTQTSSSTRENKVSVDEQIKWFEKVVESVKGKYDYIIVQQHYSYIVDKDIKYGKFTKWSPVFKKYMVDLALGADTHDYSRSAPLYFIGNKDDETLTSNNVSVSNEKGTIYMTAFQLDGNGLSSDVKNKATFLPKSSYFGGGGRGGCKIEITNKGINLSLYTAADLGKNTVTDSVFISKKSHGHSKVRKDKKDRVIIYIRQKNV